MNALNILIEASRYVDQNIKTNNKDKYQLSIKMIDDDGIDNKMMNIINNDDDNDVDNHDNGDDDDDDDQEEEDDNDEPYDYDTILGRHGWTPLHRKGYDDIVIILITHVIKLKRNLKVFINAQDKMTGWTALYMRNNDIVIIFLY